MFIHNFKIGADIEVFLRDKISGEIVTAEGIIPGTKKEPFKFDPNDGYFATSLDNVMAEFCIPPSQTPAEFYYAIEKALKHINSIVPKNLETVALPASYIAAKWLQTENAQTFGCDPDFNVWTEMQNMAPDNNTTMRTCGGHIHIGYDNPNSYINTSLIKAMDIFIGVPSILLEPDNERKEMYGKAGAYREKVYGVEYRTISNYYLQSKELTQWVFENTKEAINFVNQGKCNFLGEEEKQEIVHCINGNDKALADMLIKKYDIKIAA